MDQNRDVDKAPGPRLEITGPRHTLPRLRLPKIPAIRIPRVRVPLFIWVGIPLWLAIWFGIQFQNGLKTPPDPRLYGRWDGFSGPLESASKCDTWMLSPPQFYIARMREERDGTSWQWGVRNDVLYIGLG